MLQNLLILYKLSNPQPACPALFFHSHRITVKVLFQSSPISLWLVTGLGASSEWLCRVCPVLPITHPQNCEFNKNRKTLSGFSLLIWHLASPYFTEGKIVKILNNFGRAPWVYLMQHAVWFGGGVGGGTLKGWVIEPSEGSLIHSHVC